MEAFEMTKQTHPVVIRYPWQYLGISRSTWYNLKKEGLTPEPINISERCRGYLKTQIDEWIVSRQGRNL